MIMELNPSEWKEFSFHAHKTVFKELRTNETDRVDFALVVGNGSVPETYCTCLELDKDSVYLQHGGSFPGTQGNGKTVKNFMSMHEYLWEKGFKRISFIAENNNVPMIKIGLKTNFKIIGTRHIDGSTMVEFMKEKQ